MIFYVDTSTLLKLVVEETGSDRAVEIWSRAERLASVSLIAVEAVAALASAARGGRLTASQLRGARVEVEQLLSELHIVEVTADLVAAASDLAEAEGLRGYDAVHLAAAEFVGAAVLTSADADLCSAAERRGFHVANPLEA